MVISGQNLVGQESMTYTLSRHSKNQTGDQWTKFGGTGINDLQPVKASKNQNGDQWTEFRGTGINNLHPVKAYTKPK